jgi:hypothetical protein
MTISGLHSDLVSIITVTVAVALGMILLGLRQGLLSFRLLTLRPTARRCPTCGQRLREWTCWSCTSSRGT